MRMHTTTPTRTAHGLHALCARLLARVTTTDCPRAMLALAVLTCAVPALAVPLTGSVAHASAHETLDVRSALLLDMSSGRILYEQNADESIPPASLTKVLSMYVALDKVRGGRASLKDTVRVSRRACSTGGARMFLKQGETLSLGQLLEGMAVSSGNDASVATAEYIGGNVENFVRLMNAKAKTLGMKNSVFLNPHGLPAAGQRTTARDMLTLSRSYLLQHPEALRYHSTRFIRHNKVITTNKNPLLGNSEGADGLKTGWVFASGYNLISTVKRGKTRLLAVILGAETIQARAREMSRLVEAGFRSVSGGGMSVAALLAHMDPADYAVNLHKTKSDAYAQLRRPATSDRTRKKMVAAAKINGKPPLKQEVSPLAKTAAAAKKAAGGKAAQKPPREAGKAGSATVTRKNAPKGAAQAAPPRQGDRKNATGAEPRASAAGPAGKDKPAASSTAATTPPPGKKITPRKVTARRG